MLRSIIAVTVFQLSRIDPVWMCEPLEAKHKHTNSTREDQSGSCWTSHNRAICGPMWWSVMLAHRFHELSPTVVTPEWEHWWPNGDQWDLFQSLVPLNLFTVYGDSIVPSAASKANNPCAKPIARTESNWQKVFIFKNIQIMHIHSLRRKFQIPSAYVPHRSAWSRCTYRTSHSISVTIFSSRERMRCLLVAIKNGYKLCTAELAFLSRKILAGNRRDLLIQMNGATQLNTWKLYNLQNAPTSSLDVCDPKTRKVNATMRSTSVM